MLIGLDPCAVTVYYSSRARARAKNIGETVLRQGFLFYFISRLPAIFTRVTMYHEELLNELSEFIN